jgi:predicted nucleotidyltransferase
MEPHNNPILKRFRTALNEMYGDRLERVVLFGSRARGDADEESDYDIAVFLRDMSDPHVVDAGHSGGRDRFVKPQTAAFLAKSR